MLGVDNANTFPFEHDGNGEFGKPHFIVEDIARVFTRIVYPLGSSMSSDTADNTFAYRNDNGVFN